MAILTSGNLTRPGLSENVEYGVALAGEDTVIEVRSDLESYSKLGAKIPIYDLAVIAKEMRSLTASYQAAQNSIRKQAQRTFKELLEATRVQLLRYRAKGRTTQAIFSEAIKFLLAKSPLRTEELHLSVQRLHPDLCDDSIERVIDGVRFGKKWKHYVRNAQQQLKRQGEIQLDGKLWHLAPNFGN